jgi:hypothetical protein
MNLKLLIKKIKNKKTVFERQFYKMMFSKDSLVFEFQMEAGYEDC